MRSLPAPREGRQHPCPSFLNPHLRSLFTPLWADSFPFIRHQASKNFQVFFVCVSDWKRHDDLEQQAVQRTPGAGERPRGSVVTEAPAVVLPVLLTQQSHHPESASERNPWLVTAREIITETVVNKLFSYLYFDLLSYSRIHQVAVQTYNSSQTKLYRQKRFCILHFPSFSQIKFRWQSQLVWFDHGHQTKYCEKKTRVEQLCTITEENKHFPTFVRLKWIPFADGKHLLWCVSDWIVKCEMFMYRQKTLLSEVSPDDCKLVTPEVWVASGHDCFQCCALHFHVTRNVAKQSWMCPVWKDLRFPRTRRLQKQVLSPIAFLSPGEGVVKVLLFVFVVFHDQILLINQALNKFTYPM